MYSLVGGTVYKTHTEMKTDELTPLPLTERQKVIENIIKVRQCVMMQIITCVVSCLHHYLFLYLTGCSCNKSSKNYYGITIVFLKVT